MLKPVGNRVIVKPKNDADTAAGGRIILSKKDDRQIEGTVIAVGDGEDVQRFKVGDLLVHQKYGPADVKIDGVDHVIVHIDEILAFEEQA